MAFNTVQTHLRRMEARGLVKHHAEGRAFVYTANYNPEHAVCNFLDRMFGGAVDQLLQALLRSGRVAARDITSLETLIRKIRRGR